MLSGKLERTFPTSLRAKPALRWLAIALLVFAQLSFASHVHEIDDFVSHDCTLCSQLSTVEHGGAGHASLPLLPEIQAIAAATEWIEPTTSSERLLPPTRAPPAL